MKFVAVTICAALFTLLQTADAQARTLKEYRTEADQYYQAGNFKKAYKGYFKLAKIGDHYSQYWVSYMFENGEGKKASLEDAYAWSVLAAESGREKLVIKSDALLERVDNKAVAQKKANKLMKKYGKEALDKKADMLAKRDTGRRSGSCVGSRLTCHHATAHSADMTTGDIIMPGTGGVGEQ